MGQYFDIVNLTKRELFNANAFDQNIKEGGLGFGLQTHALMLLLQTGYREQHPLIGSWCGDRIAVIGDNSELYESLGELDDYKNLNQKVLNLIAVCRFEQLVNWIKECDYLPDLTEAVKSDPLVARAFQEANRKVT